MPEQRGLRKVRPTLIRDDVLSSLRSAILQGTFRAGEHLIESELAGKLGTSRVPVRDALKELAREGLVAIHPFRGAVVESFLAEDIREIYALRILLEGFATRMATENATGSDIELLQKIHEELRGAVEQGDVTTLVLKDFEFHQEICRLSGNRRLFEAWSALASQTRLVMTLADQVYFEPSFVLQTHAPILQALCDRDPDAAERAVTFHLGEVAELIVEKMENVDAD